MQDLSVKKKKAADCSSGCKGKDGEVKEFDMSNERDDGCLPV